MAAGSALRAYQLLEERLLSRGVTPCVEATLPQMFRLLADAGEGASLTQLLDYTQDALLAHPSRDKCALEGRGRVAEFRSRSRTAYQLVRPLIPPPSGR